MYRLTTATQEYQCPGNSEALYHAQRWALQVRGQTVTVWDVASGLKLRDIWWDREQERLQEVTY